MIYSPLPSDKTGKSYIVHTSYLASQKRGHTYPRLNWTNRERSSAATQADTILKDPDPNGISHNQEPIPNHAIRHPESEKSEKTNKKKKKPAQKTKWKEKLKVVRTPVPASL